MTKREEEGPVSEAKHRSELAMRLTRGEGSIREGTGD
jgi:hypothetical protein